MKPRFLAVLALGLVLGGGIYGYHLFGPGRTATATLVPAMPLQTVAAERATMQSWQSAMTLVGDLRASRGADLSLQVSGIVQTMPLQSGQKVEAGTLLLQLNADDQIAKLRSLQATANLAALTLKRDLKQLKINAVSQAVVDIDKANLENAQALADQQRALVVQYSLSAPFAGQVGIRKVDIGQYLDAGTPVVTLQALDPIFADFLVPQRFLGDLSVGAKMSVSVDAYPDRKFEGAITAINPKVESTNRNVLVRASLPNGSGELLPGMFATVSLLRGQAKQFITLPQTAIVSNPYGSTVFLLKTSDGRKTLTAQQTIVKTGETRGDLVAVLSGVNEGDLVVVSGQLKLRNGTPVVVDNSHVPKPEPQTVE